MKNIFDYILDEMYMSDENTPHNPTKSITIAEFYRIVTGAKKKYKADVKRKARDRSMQVKKEADAWNDNDIH